METLRKKNNANTDDSVVCSDTGKEPDDDCNIMKSRLCAMGVWANAERKHLMIERHIWRYRMGFEHVRPRR